MFHYLLTIRNNSVNAHVSTDVNGAYVMAINAILIKVRVKFK